MAPTARSLLIVSPAGSSPERRHQYECWKAVNPATQSNMIQRKPDSTTRKPMVFNEVLMRPNIEDQRREPADADAWFGSECTGWLRFAEPTDSPFVATVPPVLLRSLSNLLRYSTPAFTSQTIKPRHRAVPAIPAIRYHRVPKTVDTTPHPPVMTSHGQYSPGIESRNPDSTSSTINTIRNNLETRACIYCGERTSSGPAADRAVLTGMMILNLQRPLDCPAGRVLPAAFGSALRNSSQTASNRSKYSL